METIEANSTELLDFGRPSWLLQAYYLLKPAIPRWLQILLRRKLAEIIRYRHQASWPISHSAAQAPAYWGGWKDGKPFAVVLTHDVEDRHGYDAFRQLLEIEQKMGFVASYNFVPERYPVKDDDIAHIKEQGFEIGVHGLNHDGKLLKSEKIFRQRAHKINQYIRRWGACGFRAPSMHHNLDLFKELDIAYDLSTFDTDPFEPQSDGMDTIFPFYILKKPGAIAYWELPYTLPQDNTMFIILQEKNIDIWKQKTDWIAENGGMVLLNTHPDYMNFNGHRLENDKYPVKHYIDFLNFLRRHYKGQYWNPLPRELVSFCNREYGFDFKEVI